MDSLRAENQRLMGELVASKLELAEMAEEVTKLKHDMAHPSASTSGTAAVRRSRRG